MATIKLGPIAAELRGSIGGTVFSRNAGGDYARQRVAPVNPQTSFQTEVRNNMNGLAVEWTNLLSAAQRLGWVEFGKQFPVSNRVADVIVLSGIASYQRVNLPLLRAGFTRITDPPLNQDVDVFLTGTGLFVSLPAMPGDADFNFTFEVTGLVDSVIQLDATPSLPAGQTFIKSVKRLVFTSSVGPAVSVQFGTEWRARFGQDPIVGRAISVLARILRTTNGALSTPFRADAVVTQD